MFRKMKHKHLRKKQIKKYLSYAMGEIVLVVLGILIAVSINNWNISRNQNKIKQEIIFILIDDINNDLKNLDGVIDYYEKRERFFKKVLQEDRDEKEILNCSECRYLVTSRTLFSMNERGIEQLKRNARTSEFQKDILLFDVINLYNNYDTGLNQLSNMIADDALENLKHFRDSYSWFPKFQKYDIIDEELINYFGYSSEYKNMVSYHYTLVYENYLPALKQIRKTFKELLSDLKNTY
jgi:hypothetical protein